MNEEKVKKEEKEEKKLLGAMCMII